MGSLKLDRAEAVVVVLGIVVVAGSVAERVAFTGVVVEVEVAAEFVASGIEVGDGAGTWGGLWGCGGCPLSVEVGGGPSVVGVEDPGTWVTVVGCSLEAPAAVELPVWMLPLGAFAVSTPPVGAESGTVPLISWPCSMCVVAEGANKSELGTALVDVAVGIAVVVVVVVVVVVMPRGAANKCR